MHFSSAAFFGALLLVSQTHAFIVGETVQYNVTTEKCLLTTGHITVPGKGVDFDFKFNQVGKYACVLNDVKSVGDARNAPGDDPNLQFTVGGDVEKEVFWKNCLKATGNINIPGKGTAPVTFLKVDKYACKFSIVGPFSNIPVNLPTTLSTITVPSPTPTPSSSSAPSATATPSGDCEVHYVYV